ncbi:hypothetical protein EVAR_83047_1 [Eumeta japonica]|uniref:Uncharacterized protein n=1 Tax=Eumeta variegata TaxID=151549 RepID=A0A4C1VN10_EUMVA|nr:hypothetical protein EVAR_83047_1 [Eumeta japonica]
MRFRVMQNYLSSSAAPRRAVTCGQIDYCFCERRTNMADLLLERCTKNSDRVVAHLILGLRKWDSEAVDKDNIEKEELNLKKTEEIYLVQELFGFQKT